MHARRDECALNRATHRSGRASMLMTATKDDLKNLRVDQVGSLSAPQRLQQVFARYKRGEASEAELAEEKDRAICHVIERQEAIGLPVVTDGELRRRNFQESFGASVSGFDVAAV